MLLLFNEFSGCCFTVFGGVQEVNCENEGHERKQNFTVLLILKPCMILVYYSTLIPSA